MKKIIIVLLSVFILIGCNINDNDKEYEYTEEDIVVHGKFDLDGKLMLPQSDDLVPAVVFVHGSGPADMDSSIGALKPFKNLAEELAKKGIASIRYDKISYTHLDKIATDLTFTIQDKIITDALAAVNILKEDDRIDKDNIFVIGLSLGGQMTPVIINQDPDIKGGVLLAGSPMHLIDIAMEQLRAQDSPYYNVFLQYSDYFKNLEAVVSGEEGHFFMGAYQQYWVSYNLIDIEEETKQAASSHRLLIMQGGLDLHFPTAEIKPYGLYQELLAEYQLVEFKYYDNLNHLFVDGTDETLDNAYSIEKLIPDEVINDIVSFIRNTYN